jgi:hypothetical protein
MVGNTSRSRKGTGRGHVMARMRTAAPFWVACNIETGLSSGEGIVHALRDQTAAEKEKGEGPLVQDKRLLVVQSEFSAALKMLTREGNILSDVLRDAWDGIPLGTLTKNSRERASEYHLSVIGNITVEELTRTLNETESANGFGNRFLWVAVQRARLLPDGGDLAGVDFSTLDARLDAAIAFAQQDHILRRDAAAGRLWRQAYPRLTAEKLGLLGSMTARAEAQVVRLSLIYALLDCSEVIRVEHLRAALACSAYIEQSVRFIFGDKLGDPMADTILDALRRAPNGLTRTAISELFHRNAKAEKIAAALNHLAAANLAYSTMVKTGGKDAEVWHARQPGENVSS